MIRHKPMKRGGRIKPRNAKRRQSEFARCYGSKERVEWVKSLPCVYCYALSPFIGNVTAGHSHNAHTVTGGTGRKADYTTIVPLCASHHRRYDEHLEPFNNESIRLAVQRMAAVVEHAWQAYQLSLS